MCYFHEVFHSLESRRSLCVPAAYMVLSASWHFVEREHTEQNFVIE